MKIFLDCYPCFLKQALECTKMSDGNPEVQKKVLNRTMEILSEMDLNLSPPQIARDIYREIHAITGKDDPYMEIREKDNRQMMEVYHDIRERILKDKDSLLLACKLAAGGNIIDSGTGERKKDHTLSDVEDILITLPEINDFPALIHELENSSSLLYLGDNSGEIVMDRLFIEAIKKDYPHLAIHFAVRGAPVINDIVLKDAQDTGIDELCGIVSNGDCSPGTDLRFCSEEFKDLFNSVDLIISKGQGNYETISDLDKNIFHLLIAKCKVVARHLEVDQGSMIIKKGSA
ncbi:DUF89 domain-containing protein [Elusimicrobiota bacterium]